MTFSILRSNMFSRMRAPAPRTVVELVTAAALALAAASAFSLPLTAQTAPATPAPANAAAQPTTAAMGRQSMYSDRRDYAVGDIVTILIDDYTITTALKENVSSDTRSRGLSLSAKMPTSSKSVGLDTRNDASQNERGSAKRENRFQNEMSVRVVAIGQNGLLQLKGTKNINVDKNVQDITLTGWVRAQDISQQNMIESAKIADASIGYTSPGNLTKPKQGMISKVLGAFWP